MIRRTGVKSERFRDSMRDMIMKNKLRIMCLILFSAALLITFGAIIYKFSIPDSVQFRKEGAYSPLLTGEKTELDFDHYVSVYPWYYYFGCDMDAEEVVDKIESQHEKIKTTVLRDNKDGSDRYMFLCGEKGNRSYQELYVLHRSFFDDGGYSYLLFDGLLNLSDGDEEYIFLFPCAVLDIDWEEILSGGGFPANRENKWMVSGSLFEGGYDVIDFLYDFYSESALYDVKMTEKDKLEVIFDEAATEKTGVNSGEDVRYDRIFKNVVAIYYDEVSESIHISA